MTIGISKDVMAAKIAELYQCADRGNDDINGLSAGANIAILKVLLNECIELDPWLPIENAPKDKELLGFIEFNNVTGYKAVIHWGNILNCWVDDLGDPVIPKKYKELPQDPKE